MVTRTTCGDDDPTKPFTLYSYRLDPPPGFLVNGHLVRRPW